jgi:hypothetical protein
MNNKIPRESNGHCLPPPVPAEQICLIEPHKWEAWWRATIKFTEKQDPCCVCGAWKPRTSLFTSHIQLVHAEVQRTRLNTRLEDLFLCRGCKSTCKRCKMVVPRPQTEKRGCLCEICIDKKKSTI